MPTTLGILGLGAAGQAFLPSIARSGSFRLGAVCDLSPDTADHVGEGVSVFSAPKDLFAAPGIDAVYIGTPTDMHHAHVMAALAAGKHVLVEKPMATTVADALEMAEAAESAGLVLAVGHAHGYDLPIKAMRDIVLSGRIGRVRAVNTLCYTDWVYRPRRPDELKVELGGGVTYRQGGHQFDILNTLADAPAETVTAVTFDLDPDRSTLGAHSAMITYRGGAVGNVFYNGYGRFLSTELTGGIGEWGHETIPPDTPPAAPATPEAEAAEIERKRARARSAIPAAAPYQPHYGLTLVTGEKGEMRQTRDGLMIYTAQGAEKIDLPTVRTPRDLVLEDFAAAIDGTRPCLRDGRWGAAIVELCAAVVEAGRTCQTIELKHQPFRGKELKETQNAR
jgi:phthalate 4,5-cis-dihydrodiol dehydrogenase